MSSAVEKGDMDGLLLDDAQSLRDRITYLEKKVAEQAEDLACMKSAIADCIRRMGQLESTRGAYPNKFRSKSSGPPAKNTLNEAQAHTPLANTPGSRPRMPRRGPGSLTNASPRRPLATSQSVNEVRAASQSARPTNQALTPTQQQKSIKSPGTVTRHGVAGTVSGSKARLELISSVMKTLTENSLFSEDEDPLEPETWCSVYGVSGAGGGFLRKRTYFQSPNSPSLARFHTTPHVPLTQRNPRTLPPRNKQKSHRPAKSLHSTAWRPGGLAIKSTATLPPLPPRPTPTKWISHAPTPQV